MIKMTEFFNNTILGRLDHWAICQPNKVAYGFLSNSEDVNRTTTFGQLRSRVLRLSSVLKDAGVHPGDRVVLLFESGIDVIEAFLACLHCKSIAVMSYPPKKNRKSYRVQSIINDTQPALILSSSQLKSRLQLTDYISAAIMYVDEVADVQVQGQNLLVDIQPDDIAFIQYTSGSTSEPKGVMVSHANIISNERMIYKGFNHSDDMIVLGWLPFFHDMGLIGNILHPLYYGRPSYLMAPTSFLLHPIHWLDSISKLKITTSGGPNFAYDLCVNQIKEEELYKLKVDLSSWKVAFNGAEPIRSHTLRAFSEKFKPFGFNPESFLPCYGMAETTLFVSGGGKSRILENQVLNVNKDPLINEEKIELSSNQFDGDSHEFVNCGVLDYGDQTVAIVDPKNRKKLQDRHIGEIWVSGSHIGKGYWKKKDETDATFRAFIVSGEGPFLRTGDLGFIESGCLYVAGRMDDVIIINGANQYPQDIEFIVEQASDMIIPHSVAAFSHEKEGKNELIVLAEINRTSIKRLDGTALSRDIVQALSEQLGVSIHHLIFVKPFSLPKTSSGKIQRKVARQHYLEGALSTISAHSFINETTVSTIEDVQIDPTNLTKETIMDWLKEWISRQQQIPVSDISSTSLLSSLGINSMEVGLFVMDLESALNKEIPLHSVYEYPTIGALAEFIYQSGNGSDADSESIKLSDQMSEDVFLDEITFAQPNS